MSAFQDKYAFGTIFFGDEAVSIFPQMGALIGDGRHNLLEIKENRLFFLSSKREPCLSETANQMVDRVVRCIENYTLQERRCRFITFQRDHGETNLRSYCNMQYFDREIGKVFKECNQREIGDDIPCAQVQFETSVRDFPHDSNTTRIELKYRFTNYMKIQEHELYTWQTFMSNIGGLLSLLCGASVISLVQVLYYFCTYAANAGNMQRNDSVQNERQRDYGLAPATTLNNLV